MWELFAQRISLIFLKEKKFFLFFSEVFLKYFSESEKTLVFVFRKENAKITFSDLQKYFKKSFEQKQMVCKTHQ